MRWIISLLILILAGCDVPAPTTSSGPAPRAVPAEPLWSPAEAARGWAEVVARVEPVAERECRRQTVNTNCDFRIVVDKRRGVPSNAFQSVDASGRPVITFTIGLIAEARNVEELAFVMGHEAAHHIAGHLGRQQQNAAAGAVIFAGLATLTGGTAADVAAAQELGAVVGARSYSKEFELEADRLGTVITYRAGYDPLKGAQFFNRIPDPGNRFLGTHPPNAERMEMVRRTVAQLR